MSLTERQGFCWLDGKQWVEMGGKLWKFRAPAAEFSGNRAVFRAKCEEGGCSTAVDSWGNGVYASYTQQRIAAIAEAQQAAIAREEDRKDMKLADELETNEKTREKIESEMLLNLEKAETEESKNLRDDYTIMAKANMDTLKATEVAQPAPQGSQPTGVQ